MTGDLDAGRAEELVLAVLRSSDLEADQVDTSTWMTQLSGEWKRTIPVMLRLDHRHLRIESLLCRAPDEAHEEVYRYLLLRNQRTGPIRFALDDEGNIVLLGQLPLEALDETSFDRLLGTILVTADEVYNAVLRRGFSTYIEAEQQWRASRDMAPNPITEASAD